MKWIHLIVLLFAGLAGGLIAFAPLGTALRALDADARGLGWQRSEGTIVSGALKGIAFNGMQQGDATLKLKPLSLLSGRIGYDVTWASEHGRGDGSVSIGGGQHAALHAFNLVLDLRQLENAALWIRQSGGSVRLQGQIVRFDRSGCATAEGSATSDVLERNIEILGAGWAPMRGDLRCENGDLVIPLESENASGTRFSAQLRIAPNRPGRLEARVSGLLPRDLEYALPIAGFAHDGADYVYTFSASTPGEPIR